MYIYGKKEEKNRKYKVMILSCFDGNNRMCMRLNQNIIITIIQ